MTTRPASPAKTLALAAVLAACLPPALAQKAPIVTQAYDPYTAQVDPLPKDCNFLPGKFIDGSPPRARPVAVQKPALPIMTATTAQVVPVLPASPGYRQVAYSYNVARLSWKIPGLYVGIFHVDNVRVAVYKGPTTAFPMASDRTTYAVDNIFWSNSVGEAAGSIPSALYNNVWLVRITSTGKWQEGWGAPWVTAVIGMDCTIAIKPASPPLLQQ